MGKQEMNDVEKYVVHCRREIHRNPELSFKEFETARFIENELKKLGIKFSRIAGTGIVADIAGKLPGIVVALRADMDALPIKEESGENFASKNVGVMHACGHDAHVAMLLGVCKMAMESGERFSGTIRVIFQPGEESPPGGAVKLIEKGVLEGVKYIIGQHVLSTMPAGTVGINYGMGAAYTDDFKVTFTGRGGHGSRPHETSDVLLAASIYTILCQTVISRMIDQTKPAVLTFGTFHSGDRENIISSKSALSGTVRTYDVAVRDKIQGEMRALHRQIKSIYKCKGTFEYNIGYPALINNSQLAHIVEKVAMDLLGKERVISIDPSMGGEDFAYYLQRVPGCFYRLGVGNEQKGIVAPQHSKEYRIDENALIVGTEIMFKSALALLAINP